MSKKKDHVDCSANKLIFHVRKLNEPHFFDTKWFTHECSEMADKLKTDIAVENLVKHNDIDILSEYIMGVFNKRIIKSLSPEITMTLAFEFDKTNKILYIGWAKPCPFDLFNKKLGYKIATRRVEKLKELYVFGDSPKGSIPIQVQKNIDKFLPRVEAYYKEMVDGYSKCTFAIPFGE